MKRFENISPFIVMDILDRARKMEDVIHLEVGEPDLDPPPEVIEAFIQAVRDGKYKYTASLGLIELRETIAHYYEEKYGVHISPGRIVITPGTSGAFLVAYALLLDAGGKIALSDPSYPCYKNFAYFLNIEPVFISVTEADDFCINTDGLDMHPDIRAVQISSPSNPVGNVYNDERLSGLIEYCAKRDISFISDEIYHGLVYDEKERTALEYNDDVIVINGFSKYFCMPGFRIGWMILPDKLVRKAETAVQNIFIAANTPAQYAALKAFGPDYLRTVRDTFRERRDFIYPALKDLFRIPLRPRGAFYVWADIRKYGLGAFDFTEKLLKEARVALTPGIDFGGKGAEGFVRFAFTRPVEELAEGIKRIKDFLSTLPPR